MKKPVGILPPSSLPGLRLVLLGEIWKGAAAAVNTLLISIVGLISGDGIFGTEDFAEALSDLVGFYGHVMFPVDGGLLGAIAVQFMPDFRLRGMKA